MGEGVNCLFPITQRVREIADKRKVLCLEASLQDRAQLLFVMRYSLLDF